MPFTNILLEPKTMCQKSRQPSLNKKSKPSVRILFTKLLPQQIHVRLPSMLRFSLDSLYSRKVQSVTKKWNKKISACNHPIPHLGLLSLAPAAFISSHLFSKRGEISSRTQVSCILRSAAEKREMRTNCSRYSCGEDFSEYSASVPCYSFYFCLLIMVLFLPDYWQPESRMVQ